MTIVEALLTDTLSPKRTALLAATLTNTNSVFLHSHKRPAPIMDTFFAPQGCPLRRASTEVKTTAKNIETVRL